MNSGKKNIGFCKTIFYKSLFAKEFDPGRTVSFSRKKWIPEKKLI
jgi:hypothetical protein